MPPGHGDLLRRKIRLSASLLNDVSTRFWEHDELAVLFPAFLLTIYGSVRATVPLMSAAISELRRRAPCDELDRRLIAYLEQHAREEADHEDWLLADLASLGVGRETARSTPGSPAIASLVGAQYYWIHHAHPVALLGFFAVLEGHPPTVAHVDDVRRRTGLPADGFRMLRRHAELDAAHSDELFALIDDLPLRPREAALLGVSAFHTIGALGDVFRSLLGGADRADAVMDSAGIHPLDSLRLSIHPLELPSNRAGFRRISELPD
jgi:hypothetical protein